MTMTVDVVNYFEEIDIPFFFLCIVIFLVKINVTRVAILFKAYFLNIISKTWIFVLVKNIH